MLTYLAFKCNVAYKHMSGSKIQAGHLLKPSRSNKQVRFTLHAKDHAPDATQTSPSINTTQTSKAGVQKKNLTHLRTFLRCLQGQLQSTHRARMYFQVTVYLRAYLISAAVSTACTFKLPNSESLLFADDWYTRKCTDST